MELVQLNAPGTPVELRCTHCPEPTNTFRVELRLSESTRLYNIHRQIANMTLGAHDELVVICTGCENEISIIDNTEGHRIHLPGPGWLKEWEEGEW